VGIVAKIVVGIVVRIVVRIVGGIVMVEIMEGIMVVENSGRIVGNPDGNNDGNNGETRIVVEIGARNCAKLELQTAAGIVAGNRDGNGCGLAQGNDLHNNITKNRTVKQQKQYKVNCCITSSDIMQIGEGGLTLEVVPRTKKQRRNSKSTP
jgi:hypothetical protein